jgi:hypothetical protein
MLPAGAVDLSNSAAKPYDLDTLKGGDAEKQAIVAENMLKQNHLLCNCGERMGPDAIKTFGTFAGKVPTPKGPQDGAFFVEQPYCSVECAEYLDAVENGMHWQGETAPPEGPGLGRVVVLGHRPMPIDATWFEHEEKVA